MKMSRASIVIVVLLIVILAFVPVIPEKHRVQEPVEKTVTSTVSEPFTETKYMTWECSWRRVTGDMKWGEEVGTGPLPQEFDFDWGTGNVYGLYNDYIGFVATANIFAGRAGTFQFTMGCASDDIFELYIDGEFVGEAGGFFTDFIKVLELPLAGLHTLTIHYYESTGNAAVSFHIDDELLSWEETEYRTVEKTETIIEYREVEKTEYVSLYQLLMRTYV